MALLPLMRPLGKGDCIEDLGEKIVGIIGVVYDAEKDLSGGFLRILAGIGSPEVGEHGLHVLVLIFFLFPKRLALPFCVSMWYNSAVVGAILD